MSIKNIKFHYQVEGVLKNKRKVLIYDLKRECAVDIQDISRNDVKRVGIHVNMFQDNAFIKDYYDYDGQIYEPYNFNIDLRLKTYYESLEHDDTGLLLKKPCFRLKGAEDNIRLEILTKSENPIIEIEDMKEVKSSNIDYMMKKIKELSQNVICLDGELYKKTIGPVFFSDRNSEYDINYIKNFNDKKLPFYFNFLPEHEDVKRAKLFDDFLPVDFIHCLSSSEGSCEDVKSLYHIYDMNSFINSNYKLYGRHLFETTMGQKLEDFLKKRYSSFNPSRLEKIDDIKIDNFMDKIYNKYEFGDILKNLVEQCKAGYNLEDVMDTLDFISENFMKFDNNKNEIIFKTMHDNQFYSDREIMRTVLQEYDREYLIKKINIPSENRENHFVGNGYYFTKEFKTLELEQEYKNGL